MRSRGIIAGLLLVLWAPMGASAQAGGPEAVVLWLSDAPARAEQAAALAVEVAPRNAQVLLQPAPPGSSAGDRAMAARGAARGQGADAALWLEGEADGSRSVRAVAADREHGAWAPVPASADDPRLVALIATSLLDELLAAPEVPDVTVRFRIPRSRRLDAPMEATDAAPASAATAAPPRLELSAPGESAKPQARDFYLELGGTFAVVAAGGAVGIGFYPDHHLRLSMNARVTWVYLADIVGSAFSVGAAYVTDDDDGRFELGGETGLILTDGGNAGVLPGYLATAMVGMSWGPWAAGRLGLRLSGGVAIMEGDVTPTGLLELYVQVMP